MLLLLVLLMVLMLVRCCVPVFDDGRTSRTRGETWGRHRTVAPTNNCLARSNKSRAEDNATIRLNAAAASSGGGALRGKP